MKRFRLALMLAAALGATTAQADPSATRMMASACGFPSAPSADRTLPMPVGDGTFYYLTKGELEAIQAETYDFSSCDWASAAEEAYGPSVAADVRESEAAYAEAQERQARATAAPPPAIVSNIPAAEFEAAPAITPPKSPSPAPSVSMDELAEKLDQVIAIDSRSWLFNRYNFGSVSNVEILEADPATSRAVVYGEYVYNNYSRGWIKVVFDQGSVNCVEYHDFRGTCRAIGNNPAAYVALGTVAMAAAGGTGSSPAPASSNGTNCRWEQQRIPRADGGPDRVRNVEVCN